MGIPNIQKIKLLETPEELMKLYSINDNVEESYPLNKNEWVQFLVAQANNPAVMVWGIFDDSLVGYVVACNGVRPPLADYVHIMYAWLVGVEFETSKSLLEEIKEWAGAVGARKIRIVTRDPSKFYKYGFEATQEVNMELKL
jgi:hypothetical protein